MKNKMDSGIDVEKNEGEDIELRDLDPDEDEDYFDAEVFRFRDQMEGEGNLDYSRAKFNAKEKAKNGEGGEYTKKNVKETSFTTEDPDTDTFPDAELEMFDNNNLFDEEGDELANRLNNLKKKTVGVMKRYIITTKKQFVKEVLKLKINKGAGPHSKLLYDNLEIKFSKKGKIDGAEYKGEKILILRKGVMTYSRAKKGSTANAVVNFKKELDMSVEENKKTPGSLVEKRVSHDISEETVNNIVKNSSRDMDITAIMLAQEVPRRLLSGQELREISGAMSIGWNELMNDGGENLVRENIRALDIEYRDLKKKASESKEKKDQEKEKAYNTLANAVGLKMDAGRLKLNEKPEGDLGGEILNREADLNEFAKLDKFKKWAKNHLLGLSGLAITIAGVIVTIVYATRTVVTASVGALSGFAKAVVDISKKFGPVVGAVASALMSALMFGAQGLLWIAQNMWVLAVALAYFVYSEYKSRK